MNIIFIAPPAAGKGTYCKHLKEKYNFNHISAGDLLREQVNLNTSIGKEIKEIMNRGEMINDQIMANLLEKKLKSIDLTKPFMLDGYPRKLNQVNDYEKILQDLGLNVDKVIYINIDKNTGLKRILGRQICPKCGKIYNTETGYMKPLKEDVCDICKEHLIKRSDDTEETYTNRYEIYMNETKPVIEYYKKQGKLYEINGSDNPTKTLVDIEKILGVNND